MDEFLCIIHDKMDHAKTMLLRLQMCNKMISRLGQLPITLMSVIVHNHGDEGYAQYSNELWPNDPNFTIGSLLLLLRTLEAAPISKLKLLFEHPHKTHSLHICCKGNYIAYANSTPRIKLLVLSLCQEICCFKWIIMLKTIRINIC